MDALISSAIEEICFHTPTGVSLASLWSILTPTPSPSIKSCLWSNLLAISSLKFLLPGEDAPSPPNDARIQRFEDAENLNIKIVAKDHLHDSFVGLYDIPSSDISLDQRRALQRIAFARGNGVTQNELAKELGIENNKFFYILKNLECRGLIVRQPAVVKTREAGDGETKNSLSVTTNMLYLYRYAKHLGVQQRFEINKEEMEEGDVGASGDGDSVLVRDYSPAMKAVCDKLEEAIDKVLVVSDVKQALGYSGPKGHRAWRTICRRLKDASVVEELEAKVSGKVERCLRLLTQFSHKNLETKTFGRGDDCDKESMKFGRMFQQTDQLVELSLDQQIYDMIDAEGTGGVTVVEVCGRLGLDKKRNYHRFDNMVSRFGMHRQAENHKRTQAYRLWTSGNCNSKAPNAFLSKSKIVLGENRISNSDVGDCDGLDKSSKAFIDNDYSTSEVDFEVSGKLTNGEINTEFSHGSPKDDKSSPKQRCPINAAEFLLESRGIASNAELDLVSTDMETNAAPIEIAPWDLSTPPNSRSSRTYSYLSSTTNNALREQRILERLQEEKFILRSELHRWLVSLEKEKGTTMDRKTVDRILSKLQQQGHCKCVHINVPVVTNCGRNRLTMVVLHPSIQNFPPELLDEIHDKLRSFEKQIRGQGSSKWKINETIPVLNDVKRTQFRVGSDEKAIKVEAIRANGFVLAKMGRARLLHSFLWDHLTSSCGWDDVILSETDSRAYKLFALEKAMKAMPIDLFLQVAGSTQKYEDMVEKCKRGLRLYELPVEEYRSLMDSQATGRLSAIIDILRRLKLIRLVRDGHSEDGVKVPHATFRDAIELKPYIEEPLSVVALSNLRSLDLRPRIRHDFILSKKEVVDEYWKTLEYCYAAAHPNAALHAFPGCAVPEVFHHRSWTSVRVMSSDQRLELLKRIVKDDSNKTLSYKECEKIAKDLNLTIQQVLRVYFVKYHQRVNRFQSFVNADEDHQQPTMKRLSSKKRKKSSESISTKGGQVDGINEQLGEEGLRKLPNTVDQQVQHGYSSSGQHDDNWPAHPEGSHLETLEELGPDEDEECYSLISQCAFSRKPTRQSRFSWTDEADRHLLIQYVTHRAALGAKFHRVDWNMLPDLPAPPRTCARRMASLKRNAEFRKALMRLCTMLSERYAKHLEKTQNISSNNDCRVLVRCLPMKGLDRMISNSFQCTEEAGSKDKHWDDFEDRSIKRAFEDVLCYKRMTKLEVCKRVGSVHEEWSDLNLKNHEESDLFSSTTPDEDIRNCGLEKCKDSARRSRCHRLHEKFTSKLLNEGTTFSRQVYQSLAVANAVELLKLVFLSTSTAPELQNRLAETLRRYSEHDLFAAFSYLREKKIMIGGSGDQPYMLSQQFLHAVSRSPFPADTGKRAAKFSTWLHKREKELMEGVATLYADLQCGDIFQLFALVSSGELSISPCVPDEGVGEAEDLRSSKRKAADDEFCNVEKAKKLKSLADGERREKGFPGILLSVNAVELLKNGEACITDRFNGVLGQEISCNLTNGDQMQEVPNFGNVIPAAEWPKESPWEAMAGYAEYLMLKCSNPKQPSLFNPEVFRSVYIAIQKAGDQGLSTEEVSQVVGGNSSANIIDVLQSFRQVLKVNAYDSVRVVDALYQSKYFLTSLAGSPRDLKPHTLTKSLERIDSHPISGPKNHDVDSGSSQREKIMSDHGMHKVTILNCPEELVLSNETQNSNLDENHLQIRVASSVQNDEGDIQKSCYDELCMPILPWINGDGTCNKFIYDRLVRRVLGTVMQNPGILENDIIRKMDVLNPQSCRSLLRMMILDKHLTVRKMYQSTSSGPPALLGSLLGDSFGESKPEYREHFFANPMSASLL